jgi:hypothetical protein
MRMTHSPLERARSSKAASVAMFCAPSAGGVTSRRQGTGAERAVWPCPII